MTYKTSKKYRYKKKKKKKNKCVNLLDNVDLALVPFYNSTGARVAYSLIENVR